jgi:predicted ABC-type transport system involved in lysophospholipase L1 biosynthesis ATPase subunit
MFFSQCHNKKLPQQESNAAMIRCAGPEPSPRPRTASSIKGIDLEIPRRQFAASRLHRGAASTLLGLLAGLDGPTSGRIVLDGETSRTWKDQLALLRGPKIGFVFRSIT